MARFLYRDAVASMALLLFLALGLAGLIAPTRVSASMPPPARPPGRAAFSILPQDVLQAQQLIERINQVRWENGQIPPLKVNLALQQAALTHSQNMSHYDFFGHKGQDQSSPWDRIDAANYGDWFVLAENIAAGYQNPEDVVQAWLDSPRHREKLLNAEFQEAGIGYVYEPGDLYPGNSWGYQHYWTLDLGARQDSYPIVIAGETYSTTVRNVQLYCYGQEAAAEMRLSNDGINWSNWSPFKPTTEWDLSAGAGVHHVYMELRDATGKLFSAEDEIVLEEPPAPLVQPTRAVFVMQHGQTRETFHRYPLQLAGSPDGASGWHVSWDQPWLRLSASSWLVPGRVVLTLSDAAGGLPSGIYTATLSVWNETSRSEVPVTLYVFEHLYEVALPGIFLDVKR